MPNLCASHIDVLRSVERDELFLSPPSASGSVSNSMNFSKRLLDLIEQWKGSRWLFEKNRRRLIERIMPQVLMDMCCIVSVLRQQQFNSINGRSLGEEYSDLMLVSQESNVKSQSTQSDSQSSQTQTILSSPSVYRRVLLFILRSLFTSILPVLGESWINKWEKWFENQIRKVQTQTQDAESQPQYSSQTILNGNQRFKWLPSISSILSRKFQTLIQYYRQKGYYYLLKLGLILCKHGPFLARIFALINAAQFYLQKQDFGLSESDDSGSGSNQGPQESDVTKQSNSGNQNTDDHIVFGYPVSTKQEAQKHGYIPKEQEENYQNRNTTSSLSSTGSNIKSFSNVKLLYQDLAHRITGIGHICTAFRNVPADADPTQLGPGLQPRPFWYLGVLTIIQIMIRGWQHWKEWQSESYSEQKNSLTNGIQGTNSQQSQHVKKVIALFRGARINYKTEDQNIDINDASTVDIELNSDQQSDSSSDSEDNDSEDQIHLPDTPISKEIVIRSRINPKKDYKFVETVDSIDNRNILTSSPTKPNDLNSFDDDTTLFINSTSHHDRPFKCHICTRDRAKYPASLPCGHVFCWKCCAGWVSETGTCPLCRRGCDVNDMWVVRHV